MPGFLAACSTPAQNRGDPSGSPDGSRIGIGDGGSIGVSDASNNSACKNLQCQQRICPDETTTTLTGTVYAPNGTLPLYNALVYIPNSPVPPATPGLSCDRCGGIPPGNPVVAALTDHRGVFELKNVPVGKNIPLVIQVGKWRRQATVPEIVECQPNKLTNPEQTRLPRNRKEGDMPRIAITTGDCDNLVCLIPKLGIDPAEWGIAGEDKAVTFYAGAAYLEVNGLQKFGPHLAQMKDAASLWGKVEELSKYDMAILSCECDELLDENKPEAAFQAVTDYLARGGRVFGTDYQYVWLRYSSDPKLRSVMNIRGGSRIAENPVKLDTSFPKGKALADWLSVIQPASTYGQVSCQHVFDNFSMPMQPALQVWGSSRTPDVPDETRPRFVTVNTPVGLPPEKQCGRAVDLDAHVTLTAPDVLKSYPQDCGTTLRPGEEVLAFFFFDIASCIQEDTKDPEPPPIVR